MQIREERPADHPEILLVNEAAFGHPDEANLVDELRKEGVVLLSLVAELDHKIVGHILFTRMAIETAEGELPAVALAPMAVLPSHQGQRIGTRLIQTGLDNLRATGERIVIVLGHEHYYPRFGFSSAKAAALDSPFPPEAYMALELSDGALAGVKGEVRYPAAFRL